MMTASAVLPDVTRDPPSPSPVTVLRPAGSAVTTDRDAKMPGMHAEPDLVASRSVARRGPRLFATPADEPRARRASDVILLVGAVVGLAAVSAAAVPQGRFTRAVESMLRRAPDFLDGLWQLLVDALALLAVVLIVGAALRRRGSLVRDLVLAVAVAVGMWLVIGRWVIGSWPAVWDPLLDAQPPPGYPAARIAIPAAVIITASPHLSRPVRRLGRWLVLLVGIGVVTLGATTTLGAVAGLLVAAASAATIHLVFGSCGGRPGLEDVRAALAELGVATRRLGAADRQQAGLFLVDAEDEHGDPLVVKVYGRDAHDSALVTTLWRTVWYREAGSPIRLGRLQQVEHDAFLTLLARQAGVPTDTVVTAGATADDDALLVLRPLGPSVADMPSPPTDAAAPVHVWDLVRGLRRAGIAHGQLDDRHLVPVDGRFGVRDFRGGTVAPSETQERTDEAQALVSTVLLAGEEAAFAAAEDALGRDGLAAVLPYLQPGVLTRRQVRGLRASGLDLDGLRRAAAEAADVEPPALQPVRRVTLGSIVRVVLPAIAVVALISNLAQLDLDLLVDELAGAAWWLVAVGFVLAQFPRLTQAVSTLGASPVPLALGPVYALQLAVSYVGLAVPGTAGRVALNIRFFQRHGVPPGSAVAVGALDGFGGFVVQMIVLGGLLLFTSASLDIRLDSGAASTAARLLVLVVIIAVVAIGIVFTVRSWRVTIVGWTRGFLSEALQALRGLRSPRRIGMLLGASLATEVLFAITLGAFARALGFSVGLDELLLISISVSLLAGLLPIPGGIGVFEGGLTLGLVRAGLPEEAAFAAAIMFRMATFYLPPIWGFFALGWLERNKHL
jgi:uncharacterized membrane protein YbhN (UPF0104 family)